MTNRVEALYAFEKNRINIRLKKEKKKKTSKSRSNAIS